MALTDLIILGLTGTAAVFSIIELGLTADLVSDLDEFGADLARLDFLVFASVWTLLVVILLLVLPIVFGSRTGSVGWASALTLGLNGVTMIFWLAGFAAWADLFRGLFEPSGIVAAVLAFAILLWIIFLVLFILNLLTAFSVVQSERFGYGALSRKTTVP